MLLVANRGEIALRVVRTAGDLGLDTVAVHAADDADAPHVRAATRAEALPGSGPSAYLDPEAIVGVARATGCTLVHPGYGFLSENAAFAQACADAGLTFVGPSPDALRILGNKRAARAVAEQLGIPVTAAVEATEPESVRAFLRDHPGGIVVKALSGGGGRGMRVVRDAADLDEAIRLAAAEAHAAFDDDRLYAEALVERARHVEVQVVAAESGSGTRAMALGDRDCSVQGHEYRTGHHMEQVVLLDDAGRAVGIEPKATVHTTDTPLHLAFSSYVFDPHGNVLLTRRALDKSTFPGVLTNSCCGHPAPDEPLTEAVRRRLHQELGLDVHDIEVVLPSFRYRAVMDNGIVENEICPVFRVLYDGPAPVPEPSEVHDTEWVDWTEFSEDVVEGRREVSVWCREQVEQLRKLGPDPLRWPVASAADLPPAAPDRTAPELR